jgi:ribosomal protein S17
MDVAVGDVVEIISTKPISKQKSFVVANIVKKAISKE